MIKNNFFIEIILKLGRARPGLPWLGGPSLTLTWAMVHGRCRVSLGKQRRAGAQPCLSTELSLSHAGRTRSRPSPLDIALYGHPRGPL